MTHILTDSTADISPDLCKLYRIETIPMYIQIDGKVYNDGEDINPEMLFERVKNTGQYPTTSAPSPGDFINFFTREGPSIYIGVSSKLSTTFRNAQLARNEMGHQPIDLIDSRSFSTGYGQVVLQAAKWRDAGIGYEELGVKIREFIHQTRGIFILDSLDFLYHGGRCSAIENFFSSMLKIHPFLQILPDGTLGVLQKVRGSRKKAIDALLTYFKDQLLKHHIPEIYLTHLDCEDEAQYIVEQLNSLDSQIQIYEAQVGCVLATHSGPKPLGIAYHLA
jgi:DegV family protein with EDD domain